MRGFKIVVGSCLLFLLGTAIYFLITDGYTEANISTAKGMKEGQRLNGVAILYLFLVLGGMYLYAIYTDKYKDKKTKYKK
ncbi:hypothetical protein [Taibaiella koreensis]|uniref:hypothetical protein n=1 Tax=Taibaiella koreensis TaxID=1268548 RepID=UPI000E59A399|nr:hypothetical protein [Taibaiella koreensis]